MRKNFQVKKSRTLLLLLLLLPLLPTLLHPPLLHPPLPLLPPRPPSSRNACSFKDQHEGHKRIEKWENRGQKGEMWQAVRVVRGREEADNR